MPPQHEAIKAVALGSTTPTWLTPPKPQNWIAKVQLKHHSDESLSRRVGVPNSFLLLIQNYSINQRPIKSNQSKTVKINTNSASA